MCAGPAQAERSVLAELGSPVLPHFGPSWLPLFTETTELLKLVFGTEHDVLLIPGPGTAALELVLNSLVPRDQAVCAITNGFFGGRLAEQTQGLGRRVHRVEFPTGEAVDPVVFASRLGDIVERSRSEGIQLRAVTLVHHETSTGVLNPLQEIASVVRSHDLLLIVDAVSSLGGAEFAMDEWSIDACVSVPNKCLAAPAGVALVALSPRAWEAASANRTATGWYWNLETWRWHGHQRPEMPYPSTQPTNVIVALRRALLNMMNEGPENYRTRVREAARSIRSRLSAYGFRLFPPADVAAPMLSAFKVPAGLTVQEITTYLLHRHRIVVAANLDETTPPLIRVGHMGASLGDDYVEALAGAVEELVAPNCS